MNTTGHGGVREVELVLRVDPAVLDRMDVVSWLAALRAGQPVATRTRYYDTGDLAFKRRGFGFRVREANGTITQTVKTSGPNGGIVRDRMEIDVPLPSPEPDPAAVPHPDFRATLLDQLDAKPLRRIFETLIDRRVSHVMLADGGHVELCLDLGEIRAGVPREPVCEIELELRAGTPEDLFVLARIIAETLPVSIGLRSKAARGYALALGITPGAIKARRLTLDRHDTVERVFGQVALSTLGQALANDPAVRDQRLPEGVHQMRVALRRLRAGLGLFRKAMGPAHLVPVGLEAREIAGRLGAVRDLDVLEADILDPVIDAAPGDRGLRSLWRVAETTRQTAWAGLIDHWRASSDLALLALRLESLIETRPWQEEDRAAHGRRDDPPWTRPIEPYAARMLRKRWRKVEALGQNIEDLSIEDRHALRIEIKKLRYAGDFFASLYDPDEAKAYLQRLGRLQDSFGALNDVATAQILLPRLIRAGEAGSRRRARAVDQVIAFHATRAERQWHKAQSRWQDLCNQRRFWERN